MTNETSRSPHMTMHDTLGHACSRATPQALEHCDLACPDFRCYRHLALAGALQAIEASPEMTMTHVLVAYLNLLGTEPAGIAVAREALQAAQMLPTDERE